MQSYLICGELKQQCASRAEVSIYSHRHRRRSSSSITAVPLLPLWLAVCRCKGCGRTMSHGSPARSIAPAVMRVMCSAMTLGGGASRPPLELSLQLVLGDQGGGTRQHQVANITMAAKVKFRVVTGEED